MDFSKLDHIVASMKDEFLADLKKWISVYSVLDEEKPGAPFGEATRKMLDMALEDARRYGFEVNNYDGYCGDVRMGKGEKTMGILGHLDVVPLGDGWTKDPLGGEIIDGRIYGRGSGDDKGPTLAALYAMRAVRKAGIPLKDGVRLILGCDEETGMKDMRHYAQVCDLPDYGFSPDAGFPVINLEKGAIRAAFTAHCEDENIIRLWAGERCNVVPGSAIAVVRCDDIEKLKNDVAACVCRHEGFEACVSDAENGCAKIETVGVPAHAMCPENGKNAAGMLLIILDELDLANGELKNAIRGVAQNLGMDGTGKGIGIDQADEISGPLTCNFGLLRYENGDFSAQVDIRYPVCCDEDIAMANMKRAMAPFGLEAKKAGSHPPLHVPAESTVVTQLLAAYHEVTGLEPYTIAIGGGTYSRCMPNTVAFGAAFPGDEECAHMPDEYAEIDKLMLAMTIYAHAIVRLAGAQEEA